jgi:hypothetical protein
MDAVGLAAQPTQSFDLVDILSEGIVPRRPLRTALDQAAQCGKLGENSPLWNERRRCVRALASRSHLLDAKHLAS